MKLVEPSRPFTGTCTVSAQQDEEPPQVIWRRWFEIGVIAALVLFCGVAYVAMTHRPAEPVELALDNPAPRLARVSAPPTFQDEVSRVVRKFASRFDGSVSSKAGNSLSEISAAALRQVIAGPNQTVLLRRGNLLHALYLLGENGYVIVNGNQSRLVRFEDLRAMENATTATATR